MSIELESIGQDRPAAYGAVGNETDRVQLTFTNIQGQGYANIWLRSGGFIRRLSTISLFDVSTYAELVYYNFVANDEIGVNLVGFSSDAIFRATLDVNVPSNVGGDDITESTVINLAARVTRLEGIIGENTSGNSGNLPGDAGARIFAIEAGFSSLKTDLDSTKSSLTSQISKEAADVAALTTAINTGIATVNSRIDNLGTGGGGSGDGITNVIQTITASSGSTTKSLNANFADRYDIIGDATNTFTIDNVKNTNNLERVLTLAAMTTKRGTSRTYSGVTQWLTADGLQPSADNRVGYGELIYLTNIHGTVIGNARTGIQFKYGLPTTNVLVNYPMVEASSPIRSIVDTRTATFVNMSSDLTGGLIAAAPDASGFGAYIEDANDSRTARGFSVWFTLASLTAAGTEQRIFSVTEGDANNSSYILSANGSNLLFRHRNANSNITDTNITTLTAGVPYVVTAILNFTTGSQSATIYVRNLNTGVETSSTLANFAFSDRRVSTSKVIMGGGIDKKSNITVNSKIRACVVYTNTISVAQKDIIHGSYL